MSLRWVMVPRILPRIVPLMLVSMGAAQWTACSAGDTLPLSDDTYVNVMAELLALSDSPGGEPTDSARAEVLGRIGVSAEQVLAFAEGAGRDPERMERLWTAIQARADSAQMSVSGDSSSSAPAETRLGSVAPGQASGDTATPLSASDTASMANPTAPVDSTKIRAIQERLRPRRAPRP